MANFRHTVTSSEAGLEVRDIMRANFDFSARLRNRIKREKLVTLNGEKTEGWIKPSPGDVIEIRLPEEKSGFEPEPIPLFPVFEDDDLLIINKQPGLIVHPTKGHPPRNGCQCPHVLYGGNRPPLQDTLCKPP